jgi:hypothetical protein
MPANGPILALVRPSSDAEIMIRNRRLNQLPVSQWTQEELVPARTRRVVLRAVDRVKPGSRLLIERERSSWSPTQLAALRALRKRFSFNEIDRQGLLSVVDLQPRSG